MATESTQNDTPSIAVDSTVLDTVNGTVNTVNGNADDNNQRHYKKPSIDDEGEFDAFNIAYDGHELSLLGEQTRFSIGTSPCESVIIIGGGNFGASTAFHLLKLGVKTVILVDNGPRPNPRAASHDINKIVRDDYPDLLYLRMLKKAMAIWRQDPLFAPWYHQVGMLRADPTSFSNLSMAAYKAEGVETKSRFLTPDQVRSFWPTAFSTTNLEGVDEVLYNPSAGYGQADKALSEMLEAAVRRNVQFVQAEAERLLFGPDGQVTGVLLSNGEVKTADKVLIAAGARTPELLVKSAPENKSLHAGDRLLATGAVSFFAKAEGETFEKLKDIPVFKNCLPQVKGEGMSILPNGTIKFNCDMCFTNYKTNPITGERMSMVPTSEEYSTWTGPEFLSYFMKRARKTMDGLYGEVTKDVEIESYRMCWDASTPTHDFLISPLPHCPNLYVATGGSFHGWKFLPVIGEYIAAMMFDTLPAEYAERWAWDKKDAREDSANPTYQVAGDLKDLAGETEIP